jgi:hypothetical protein
MSVKDEVIQAAKATAEIYEAIMAPGTTIEKIMPVVGKLVVALTEYEDFKAMSPEDRKLAIIDVSIEVANMMKDKFIKYSDEA